MNSTQTEDSPQPSREPILPDASAASGAPVAAAGEMGSKLLTIVFTDIAGSAELKRIHGDLAAAELIGAHHATVRQTLAEFTAAREIETAGDSFLLTFDRPSDAVRFALELHERLQLQSKSTGKPVLDRIGIHLGEVLHRQEAQSTRLFGIEVDTAARVMSLAAPGQILISRQPFDIARQMFRAGPHSKGIEWIHHGLYRLKGVEDPLEICETRAKGTPFPEHPANTDKAHRLEEVGDTVPGWRPGPDQQVPNTAWRIIKQLGSGGFGEVWLAVHEVLKERRAFKFCFQAERVRALRREAALFRLIRERIGEHPHIAAIRNVKFDTPPYYIEMEYVDGADLRSWLLGQPHESFFTETTRLGIVATAARALQAAHDCGIIHRDIKPSNILVGAARNLPAGPTPGAAPSAQAPLVKLTDFGIGQVISADFLQGLTGAGFTDVLATSTSTHTGSQLYMAPELLAGKSATPQSDVYSLGVVLFQLLANDFSRPVTTDWAVSVADPLLREDLGHCFAGEPSERFTASMLAHQLELLPTRRAALERQREENRHRERAAYRRGILRAGSLAGLILLVIAALAFVALDQAAKAKHSAETSHRRAVRLSVAHGTRLVEQNDSLSALPWFVEALRLDSQQRDRIEVHQRRLESHLLHAPELLHVWHFGPEAHFDTPGPQFSPDETLIVGTERRAFSTGDISYLHLWDRQTGEPRCPPIAIPGALRAVQFQSAGNTLLTASYPVPTNSNPVSRLQLWDGRTGGPIGPEKVIQGIVRAVGFSRQGKLVLAAASQPNSPPETRSLVAAWQIGEASPVGAPAIQPGEIEFITTDALEARLFCASLFRANTRAQPTTILSALSLPSLRAANAPTLSIPGRSLGFSADHRLVGIKMKQPNSGWAARFFEMETGTELLESRASDIDASVDRLVFSASGRWIGAREWTLGARLWQFQTGRKVPYWFSHEHKIGQPAIARNDQWVATSSYDRTVRIWDFHTGKLAFSSLQHNAAVYSAVFNTDASELLTHSSERAIRHWRLPQTERFVQSFAHKSPVISAVFGARDQTLVTAANNSSVKIWPVAGPANPAILELSTNLVSVAMDSKASLLATTTEPGAVQVWNIRTLQPESPVLTQLGIAWALEFNPQGTELLVASGAPFGDDKRFYAESYLRRAFPKPFGAVTVWNFRSGRARLSFPLTNAVTCATYSPDGQWILIAGLDQYARVVNSATGAPRFAPIPHAAPIYDAAFDRGGRYILTACLDSEYNAREARVWNASTGAPIGRPAVHLDGIVRARFSPDSLSFATAGEDGVARIWDTLTGDPLTPAMNHIDQLYDVAFSADGRFVATGGREGTARVWDAKTGEPITPLLKHSRAVKSVRFSADGTKLLTGCSDGFARLWRLTSGAHSAGEIEALSALLSAQRIDATGSGLEVLDSQTHSNSWRQFQSKRAAK